MALPAAFQGLTVPRVDSQVDQAHLEKLVKKAVQEYSYKNTVEPTAYRPYKYWVTREEGIGEPQRLLLLLPPPPAHPPPLLPGPVRGASVPPQDCTEAPDAPGLIPQAASQPSNPCVCVRRTPQG